MVDVAPVDYLALGSALQDYIGQNMPVGTRVVRGRSLDAAMISNQGDLTVHILYAGDDVDTTRPATSMQVVGQIWMVVLAVKYSGDQTAERNQEIAGPLITTLLNALIGWNPDLLTKPLRRVQGPGAVYLNSFGYYPFCFRGEMVTKGKR